MSNEGQTLKISTSDGVEFTISPKVANQSEVLTGFLQMYQPEMNSIPLPNVDAKTLEKVIEYCEHHEYDKWDSELLIVDQKTLFDLIIAANYLNIQGLLDFTREFSTNKIRNKSASEICTFFENSNEDRNAEDQSDY